MDNGSSYTSKRKRDVIMRWLHISDLHFGYNAATVQTMREKLLNMAGSIKPINCIFITGDLRYAKETPSEYPEDAKQFIQELQKALDVKPQDTFIVSGNHDINRSDELTAVIEAAAKKYTTTNGSISTGTLDLIQSGRKPFLELYQQICEREEPGWHYCIPRNDFNIICLNTSLFCCKDGETGNLVVGSELLNQLSQNVDNSKPGIVLAHHDFDELRLEEQGNLELCLKDMGAVLYLCGHKHVALGHLQNTRRGNQDLHVFLCGTNMDKDPHLEHTSMDIFVGEMYEGSKQGYVQAYKWSSECKGWIPDSEFSYQQNGALDGKRYFPAETRPLSLKPLNQDVLAEYKCYLRGQCSEIELNGLPTNSEDISRRYALERIFVPLSFLKFSSYEKQESSEHSIGVDDLENLEFREPGRREELTQSLDQLIPESGVFRYFILSDPGGGKTTLLKWIASVYSFPEEYGTVETHLPRRELFPIWIRCRDILANSRPTIWNTIENIARKGEWLPCNSMADDFIAIIQHHIENGTALLLIDGLDEIGSESDRQYFVDQLHIFAERYQTVSIIVTSRITGFSIVTKRDFPGFAHLKISELSPEDVKRLCVNWYQIVYGEKEEAQGKALELGSRITEDERLYRLARNPLMLTTLLLVERRVGRLPIKRASLYDEAVQVLLETWNTSGHWHQKVDLAEAKYQLAYVAFHMMSKHSKRINKTELTKTLRKARGDFSDLITGTETIPTFIQHIEGRSALLIQKGFEKMENEQSNIAVYEFQHLTFQEYLAAYAVVERCYPTSDDIDVGQVGDVLKPYLTDRTMKEVIALAAVLNRSCAKNLTEELIQNLNSTEISFNDCAEMRELLLQFLADEVQLKAELVEEALKACFSEVIMYSEVSYLRQILEGRYGNQLRDFFVNADRKRNQEYDHWGSIPSLLTGEITNAYQFFLDSVDSEDDRQRARAVSVLANALWCDRERVMDQIDEDTQESLAQKIWEICKDENYYVKKEAFYVMRYADFICTPEDMSKYLSLSIDCLNKHERAILMISIANIPFQDYKAPTITCDTKLTKQAFEKACGTVEKFKIFTSSSYSELLLFVFSVVLACSNDQDISQLFSFVQEKRKDILQKNRIALRQLYRYDRVFAQVLHSSILMDTSRTEEQKRIIQEHILNVDLETYTNRVIRSSMRLPDYIDYSLLVEDPSVFEKDFSGISIEEISEYIHARFKEIKTPLSIS